MIHSVNIEINEVQGTFVQIKSPFQNILLKITKDILPYSLSCITNSVSNRHNFLGDIFGPTIYFLYKNHNRLHIPYM